MTEELMEVIRKHFPEAEGESISCACGTTFTSSESWSRHLAEEIELKVAIRS